METILITGVGGLVGSTAAEQFHSLGYSIVGVDNDLRGTLLGDPAVDFDTPERIGAWLAGDPEVWLSMLDRDDATTRRTALVWFEALLGKPVLFDPAAQATIRQAQLQRLRAEMIH